MDMFLTGSITVPTVNAVDFSGVRLGLPPVTVVNCSLHEGLLAVGVGLIIAMLMITWRRGREILTKNRTEQEGSLDEFLDSLCTADPPLQRLPGTAIFLNPGKQTTPLAPN